MRMACRRPGVPHTVPMPGRRQGQQRPPIRLSTMSKLPLPRLPLGTPLSEGARELQHRLQTLQQAPLPPEPSGRVIRIGLEDEDGTLVHVVETTRLVEAVKAFELLEDAGCTPARGRCSANDGRMLTRTFREPAAVRGGRV